jgi:hypothetical protein
MAEHDHKHEVRIHIDQHRYESPNPTTGHALYELGKLAAGLELYREVGGEILHLKEDEHFHSGVPVKKEITLIVNGTPHKWALHEITYVQVVTLDVPDYPKHPEITYSVTYKNGPSHKPEGTLSAGGVVKVKDCEVFVVSPTGQS